MHRRLIAIWKDYAWLPPVVLGGLAGVVVLVTILILREPRPTVVLEADEHGDTQVLVLVEGAVFEPGFHLLDEGATLADAVEAAGGPTDRARLDVLDLGVPISDAQRIVIPGPAATTTPPININTASQHELEELPGIGPALAQRIIEHRQAEGPFDDVADLALVSGISTRMVEEFEHLVTTGDE